MKRIVWTLISFFVMTVVGQNATGKTLVVYFSATGTTARAAQRIARETKADLYEIRPVKAYTAADLDWQNARSRSSVEMNDLKSRPAIALPAAQVAEYEVIYLGYPIWWDMAPRVVQTFIESHDLKGKKIVPFATSGSSGIANSVLVLRKTYPELNWQAGRLMNR